MSSSLLLVLHLHPPLPPGNNHNNSSSGLSPPPPRSSLLLNHPIIRGGGGEFFSWRRLRRRLPLRFGRRIRNQYFWGALPDQNQVHNLVAYHLANPLDLIAPAAALASIASAGAAAAALLSDNNNNKRNIRESDWVLLLLSSPTPFNRFVFLRCPSLSFDSKDKEEEEEYDNASERLLKEDRHFVKMKRRRDQDEDDVSDIERMAYQRVCVAADDGGVVSLDWPANLDLKDGGQDTTFLLIPGTPLGSSHRALRSFVADLLDRGIFPIVMNPRGCAASPLTTPRLFTAADSDDIYAAVQFIIKERPRTTLMGMGWGYGANMLTKYLAEVGDRTPLMAATCIDNPFDLEEATRLSPNRIAVDHKLRGGLIDILQSNKELFQGRAKGFNVKKAMMSKSVRDFDEAISMVSYGFDSIEEFYIKASTHGVVGKLKIPVLFIQNDDGTVPLFSIPRSSIAENPYTSLLLSTSLPPREVASGRYAASWCQHVAIEWLAAVELGLLKGRHPLLNDVDVAVNISKGFALVEEKASNGSGRVKQILDLRQSNAITEYSVDHVNDLPAGNTITRCPMLGQSLERCPGHESKELQQVNGGIIQPHTSGQTEFVQEELVRSSDSERGHVLYIAQVIMNMLEITMPGTLNIVEKEKVLTAVGQGETVLKALQDAVPEDVRGKLTTAVSEILHSQGTKLNLNGLLNVSVLPDSSVLSSNIRENVIGLSDAVDNLNPPVQRKMNDDLPDGSDNNNLGETKRPQELELEQWAFESLESSLDQDPYQAPSNNECDISSSVRKGVNFPEDNESKAVVTEMSGNEKTGSETGVKDNISNAREKTSGTVGTIADVGSMDVDARGNKHDRKEENVVQKNTEDSLDFSSDQVKVNKLTHVEEAVSPQESSPVAEAMEMEDNGNRKEDKGMQPVQDAKNMSNTTTSAFSVSQALDALTGIDDSTQAAVNSVFGVIETMITKFEEMENSNGAKDRTDGKCVNSASESDCDIKDDQNLECAGNWNKPSLQPDIVSHPPAYNWKGNCSDSGYDTKPGLSENKLSKTSINVKQSSTDCFEEDHIGWHVMSNDNKEPIIDGQLLVNSLAWGMTREFVGDTLHSQVLSNHLLSEMSNPSQLDLDTSTALLLDYFPEDDQWKLLEQPGHCGASSSKIITRKVVKGRFRSHSTSVKNDNIIEPPYTILDNVEEQEPVGECETMGKINEWEADGDKSKNLIFLVKDVILNSLKVEVGRRIISEDLEEVDVDLAADLEQVATAVSLAVLCNMIRNHTNLSESKELCVTFTSKVDVNGDNIIRAIYFSVQKTTYLKRLLPVGLIVGTSLAALERFFNVATANYSDHNKALMLNKAENLIESYHVRAGETKNDHKNFGKTQSKCSSSNATGHGEGAEVNKVNDTIMVGGVTAGLETSALMVQQLDSYKGNETSSYPFQDKGNHQKECYELKDLRPEKNGNNVATSLAEKAMSIASPVMPTKKDGEVDQERLVALLADLGQKGGILKLVGKIALLWGGIRGAMSLTIRLILFLHIAERPLYQRILGFICMVLLLWSPVVVPLLPTLMQSWAAHNSSRISELACIIGLYSAITILIVLWGKQIRGYENPLRQYGLDFTSPTKIQKFLISLVGGVVLVVSINSVNSLLGFVSFSWCPRVPSSVNAMAWLKWYGQISLQAFQGCVAAIGVSLVEELLYRSWLPEEIAVDLGYNCGIIISGLAFSLVQRSLQAVPGLWLLSLALTGARQRSGHSLFVPVGLRAGILASSFVIRTGGFLTNHRNFPLWLTGNHPLEPFSGVVGVTFSLLLAIILFPRQPHRKKIAEAI